MASTVPTRTVAEVYAELDALVDELCQAETTVLDRAGLEAALLGHERLTRRLSYACYRLIREADQRRLPDEHGCTTMGRFLRFVLRLDPREAAARARAAENAAPGRTVTGQPLPAVFAHVAAAQADGVISQRHALIVEHAVDELPEAVQAEHGVQVETELVELATRFDPTHLAILARRLVAHYDPDGPAPREQAEHPRRRLSITPRADGWAHLEGWLCPELTERFQTVLDTYAAPAAADPGDAGQLVKDVRTLGQRQHDGTLAALETLMRVGDVPSNNGVSCTLLLTMSTEQYLAGTGAGTSTSAGSGTGRGAGLARTGHGHLVPAADAASWGAGDTSILTAALNSMHAVTHYGSSHRIFTERQRRVITIRDGGCTFPGCTAPPARCQVDHIIRAEHGGVTSIDNGHLLCRYHHREHGRQHWQPVMINNVPHWIPPDIIDPHRTPLRNQLHDTHARDTPTST